MNTKFKNFTLAFSIITAILGIIFAAMGTYFVAKGDCVGFITLANGIICFANAANAWTLRLVIVAMEKD
jgi:hypothetical protein